MQLKKQFGKRVQQLRQARKITQEELAEKVGVSIESISNIQRRIHGTNFDNLEKIIPDFQFSAKTLFEFDTL